MSEIDLFRLQQELATQRQNYESMADRLRQRDADEIAKAEGSETRRELCA
jgi:uncharacterized protein involved in exopolysaccharide biosynthesis